MPSIRNVKYLIAGHWNGHTRNHKDTAEALEAALRADFHLGGAMMDRMRIMRCPVCGHERKTGCIGAVHCGPHIHEDGHESKALQMVEVELDSEEER